MEKGGATYCVVPWVSHAEQKSAEFVGKELAMHAIHLLVLVGVDVELAAAVEVATTPGGVLMPSAVLQAELIRDETLMAEHAVENNGAIYCALPPV